MSFQIKKDSGSEHVYKSLRLPTELVTTIQKLSDKNDISFNRFCIQALTYAIDHMEDDD